MFASQPEDKAYQEPVFGSAEVTENAQQADNFSFVDTRYPLNEKIQSRTY